VKFTEAEEACSVAISDAVTKLVAEHGDSIMLRVSVNDSPVRKTLLLDRVPVFEARVTKPPRDVPHLWKQNYGGSVA
jgi:hypothetical protein